jgi:hypothetical protein
MSKRRIASVVTCVACAILVVACSSGQTGGPEVSSTTGPAVSARLDRCFIDPSVGYQVVADVTAFNHSGTAHDIVVTIRIRTAAGAHEDLAFVRNVQPGRSGTGATSNHLDNSHRPTCVITSVEGL